MESIEKVIEKYALIFNVNFLRATLNEAQEFKDYLEEATLDSDKDIIVNLSICEHLDSTFLGVLVRAYKKMKNQGRSLVIIEPINQSTIFLSLNSIGKIFPLYTSVKSALEDIETKKLLEAEISELDEAIEQKREPQRASAKIASKRYNKVTTEELLWNIDDQADSEETLNQEIEEEKIFVNSLQIDETIEAESTTYPPPINKIKEEEELILIENTDGGDESDDNSITDQEFQLSIEAPSDDQGPDEGEDDVVKISPEPELVSADANYRKGTVDWEFGVN